LPIGTEAPGFKDIEKMEIIGAIIPKLLHQVDRVFKTQIPFDPNYLGKTQNNA
jgi:hypothetical protein